MGTNRAFLPVTTVYRFSFLTSLEWELITFFEAGNKVRETQYLTDAMHNPPIPPRWVEEYALHDIAEIVLGAQKWDEVVTTPVWYSEGKVAFLVGVVWEAAEYGSNLFV
jgi:hypothetical protein